VRQKSKPPGKFDISGNVVIFLRQIYNAYRAGFWPHKPIVQISLQYLVA